MKNLILSFLTAGLLLAWVGCASDTTSTSTTTRTYVSSSNDPKDMSTATMPEAPTPTPTPAPSDYSSEGIHTSGNLPGMR
jgi:hypothetical protein